MGVSGRRRTITATTMAAMLLFTTAACGDDDPPGPTPPTSSASASTPPGEAEARAAITTAYDAYRTAYITAAATADAENKDIAKYTYFPLRSDLVTALQQAKEQGVTYEGTPTWKVEITSLNLGGTPPTAELNDCFDTTNWKVLRDGKPAGSPGQAKKFVVTATAKLIEGAWYIDTSTPHRDQPC
ncbi:hypothetical protein AB0I28_33070 [Phytomonospora sp. NPDC050363]|uniref:hypothetical protein n=1 Tax=Phytomonospora sp. NPDC050363 TaxID=3155642 RepID=UPI0033D27E3D